MPFGVLSAWDSPKREVKELSFRLRLQCLSACCPLGTHDYRCGYIWLPGMVSNAFRRVVRLGREELKDLPVFNANLSPMPFGVLSAWDRGVEWGLKIV